MVLQILMLVVAVVRLAETTWTGWAVLHPVSKVNISSVEEFQKWWVLKNKIFGQESTIFILRENLKKKSANEYKFVENWAQF